MICNVGVYLVLDIYVAAWNKSMYVGIGPRTGEFRRLLEEKHVG